MKKLLSLAAGLVGMAVLAIGVGSGRGDGGLVGCGDVPVPVPAFKVHFQRTPGVGDFNLHRPVDLDGKNLSAEEAKQLRKMIEDAHFFDLKSTPPLSPVPPDPLAGYDLSVEMDGRTNSVWLVDGDVSKSLQPLIDWLAIRASQLEDFREVHMVPAKAAAEKPPVIHIEFTQSGGIANLPVPATTIDSTTLSAQDAEKLAKLIADIRFFDLPEQYPTHGTDLFEFTITVEMNGKRHSVSYDEAPAELKPLLEWPVGQESKEVPVGCGDVPVPVPAFKVHFARTQGLSDGVHGAPTVDLDGSQLSAEEAKVLRKLIEDAHFFDLKSSRPPAANVELDPIAGYDLTVEMDGRTHTIWAADGDVSKSLQPLIDALTLRAKPWLEQVPFKARVEAEQPAIRIDFTKSGGIAGFRWTTKVDSTTLSAEEAQKLAKRIADARFFDLPEQFPPSGTADGFGFTITVEMNGMKHTVNVDEQKVPAELKPLIEWLDAQAVEDGPFQVVPL